MPDMAAPATRLKLDQQALLPADTHAGPAACRAALAGGGADFLQLILAQGLGPLWHHRLQTGGRLDALPQDTAEALREARLSAAGGYLAQRAALDRLDRLFEAAGIAWLVMKGAHVRECVYPDPALRPAGDIDILVAPADRRRAARALLDAGYAVHAEPANISHEATFSHDGVYIDLHWHILRPGRTRVGLTEQLLERRQRSGGQWGPSDGDTLFLMLTHPAFAKYVCSPNMGLGRVADFLLWLQQRPADWPGVVKQLDDAGLKTAAWAMLELVPPAGAGGAAGDARRLARQRTSRPPARRLPAPVAAARPARALAAAPLADPVRLHPAAARPAGRRAARAQGRAPGAQKPPARSRPAAGREHVKPAGLRLLLGYARPYRAALALCALLMLAESALALAVPWLGGRLAGSLLADAAAMTGPILLALLALFAAQALLKFGNGYLMSRSAEHILADLRIRIYDHLQALPLGFYHQRRQGEILSLLTNDVGHLSGYVSGTLLSLMPLLLTVAGAVLMMFRIDARLALFVTLLVPLFYLLLKIIGRRLRPLAGQLQQAHAEAVATAEENLGMLPAIKTFTREPQESRALPTEDPPHHGPQHQAAAHLCRAGAAVQFLAAAGMVFVLWGLSGRWRRAAPAEMVSFLLYAALLTRPVSALADVYGQTQQARGTLQRLKAGAHRAPRAVRQAATPSPRCAATSSFATSASPTPGARPCWNASACISRPARPSPSPARMAPARARSRTC